MASNNYNPYNHPYQQSSAIPYSAYQTAPAANNVAQSRQYQQTPTTQSQDYMSYSAQSYGGQSSGYGTGQESSWNGSNYGATRETTSRAAEVLHNMSNNAYTPNTTSATNPSHFSVTNPTAQSNRYSNIPTHSPQAQTQSQATQASYAQSQARPSSVNANRGQTNPNRGLPSPTTTTAYQSQRAQILYNQQQQQRSASPAQHPYNNTSASSARSAAMTATVNQYNDYNARQLPSVDTSRSSQNATSSTFAYASASITASAPNTSVSDIYGGSSATTVDPTAIYDPWPEYQRKQEVLRTQKAVEDAAREEEERKVEEQREMEEQRRKENEEKSRPTPKQKAKKPQRQSNASEDEADPEPPPGSKEALESEIRSMMAKMRELNSKDPALLARIWEEERKAKAPRSPTTQNRPPPSEATQPAQTLQVNIGQVANSRKKAAPKESLHGKAAKQATPSAAQVVPSKVVAVGNKFSGNTTWPPEKKAQLANAAIAFLKIQNPNHSLQPDQILSMLDSNPSYLQLCERLEQAGLKLDRAAFAKSLLTAVPDINSGSQRAAPQPLPTTNVQRSQVVPAVMKNEIATPAAASPQYAPPAGSPSVGASPAATPAPVAQMVPIKPELKPPANKEEAARKRKMSDLVDLTLLSEEDDFGPPPKKSNADSMYSMGDPHPHLQDAMIVDAEPAIKNFPIATSRPAQQSQPVQPPPEITRRDYAGVLDKKKALRRNNYNPATIARDVLLACGRHPSERSLNQHLDVLRTNLPQFSFDSDLSTIRWDILDPGKPPPGYFKDVLQALTEDADDEDDSDDENRVSRPRAPSTVIGGESGAQTRAQALPEATNPFKQKKRGRPSRQSLPGDLTPVTPKRPSISSTMSASVPRSASPAGAVGYQAFRSATEYGPDGQPLPKKRGRPVGWRKAIHGSPAAQAKPAANVHTGPSKHKPSQPSSLRNVKTGQTEPTRIDSRSPSVANRVPQYQPYKCKWQNCPAELHNLETLKKHVFKVHRKETANHTLECLWDDCGKEVINFDPMTNMRLEQHMPYSFDLESNWHSHIQQRHFDPLSWELGDGPAGGLSDSHDSEAYLSDAQGRQVTPRIVVDPERLQANYNSSQSPIHARKGGRGRPQKNSEGWDDPHEAHARLVSQKKRIGGPGMDRGGATLVNEKRRRGLDDGHGVEEELVDAED